MSFHRHARRATARVLSASSTLALMVCGHAAHAQAVDAPQAVASVNDGEIIVMARKRAETLVSVPVAINAVGAKDIQRYAATDLTRIAQLVPQIIIARSSGAGSGASFIIRGIGSSQGDAGIEQTVTLNLDGVQLSRGRAVGQSFFDVQQVEVLKGPQALFFGKNSPGGVISIRSAGPTDSFEGYARAGYEFKADERYVEGAVSGPISPDFGYRVAIRASQADGYIHNQAQPIANPLFPGVTTSGTNGNPRQGGGKELLGRVTLRYDGHAGITSTLKVFGSTKKENGLALAETIGCVGHPKSLGIPDPTGDCTLDGNRSVAALPAALTTGFPRAGDGSLYAKNRFILASWTNEVKLADNVSLTAVTGYYDYLFSALDEFAYSSNGGLWTSFREKFRSISQEVRINTDFDGPINLTVGGLYEDTDRSNNVANLQLNRPVDPATGGRLISTSYILNHGQTASLFGQARANLASNLELSGGVRYTHETKRSDMQNDYVSPTANAVNPKNRLAQGVVLNSNYSDDNWSPEATLAWHPTRFSTIYAAYKTGYKSGGFSTPQGGVPGSWNASTPGFGSETAHGFEVGAKAELMDRRLRLNLTAYDYRFQNLQQTSFDAVSFLYSIRNATSARTRGVEFDGTLAVTPDLSLRASAAYNDATYGAFPTSPCWTGQSAAQGCVSGVQDLSGKSLARAPKWNAATGFTFEHSVGGSLKVGATGDVSFSSGYWMQETQNPSSWQGEFAKVDASLSLGADNDNWKLSVIGRNLTNKWYGTASTDTPLGAIGQVSVATGRPREVMVQASYRF